MNISILCNLIHQEYNFPQITLDLAWYVVFEYEIFIKFSQTILNISPRSSIDVDIQEYRDVLEWKRNRAKCEERGKTRNWLTSIDALRSSLVNYEDWPHD